MKILRQNKGEKAVLAKYVRSDMEPVQDAVDEVKWFIVEETPRPLINQFERIETDYNLTDKPNTDYPYFSIAVEKHNVIRLSDEAIIQQMNDSLGSHLDEGYPLWKRVRHDRELREGTTVERELYIQSLVEWEKQCLDARNLKENDLINNNQLPEFNWHPVPQN